MSLVFNEVPIAQNHKYVRQEIQRFQIQVFWTNLVTIGEIVEEWLLDSVEDNKIQRRFSKLRNSSRVLALDRIAPSMQLVVVRAVVFSTPLIAMHRWLDSMTTATPRGCNTSSIARATCLVNRSWTCNRRANISASRANLDRPRT